MVGTHVHSKPVQRSNPTDITVTEAVDLLLDRALERGASDVHIEPRERSVVVRYRIDGWLQEVAKFPLKRYAAVVRQIKQRAKLDTEAHLPQQASIEYDSDYGPTLLDIATMPTVSGEKIVIHLKPQLSTAATLEDLGYWGDSLRELQHAIAEPHGLVLAASLNKTSLSVSLLSMVHALNNPAFNIATLESQVTHRIPGVTQTELQSGTSFTQYLQAVLKQDPNVVMIGSLQEPAAVKLGVQAALDGRLLLGGLPAGSATLAIKHLTQLHTESFMVAAALKASTSQRFVRRLCTYCRHSYLPGPTERGKLSKLLTKSGIRTVKQLHELEIAARASGLGTDAHHHPEPLASTEKRIARLYKPNKHGCSQCHFTGYFGRQGVSETVILNDRLREAIANDMPSGRFRHLAIHEGMVPLALDGFVKALRGLTSTEEIFRL